jgi:predicted RNA binding protein YcfA (HicA-like mRNA interferase family)
VVRRLHRAGFETVRVRGSHHRLAHPDGRSTTVPIHGSEIIGPGLLSKILQDCELTRDAFDALA